MTSRDVKMLPLCTIFTKIPGNVFFHDIVLWCNMWCHLHNLNRSFGQFFIFTGNVGVGKYHHVTSRDVAMLDFQKDNWKCLSSWYYHLLQI